MSCGVDKIEITTCKAVDRKYLEELWTVSEDEYKSRLYKYFCSMGEYGQVSWKPHKFSEITNLGIAYAKFSFNPKYFGNFTESYKNLCNVFGGRDIAMGDFRLSRIDIKSDIEDLPVEAVLMRLHVSGVNITSLKYYKGTIYLGSNPKYTIYDKTKEIRDRYQKGLKRSSLELEKKGYSSQEPVLTEWEDDILRSGKQLTRFEIGIRPNGLTLQNVVDSPEGFVSYFDKLSLYDFETSKEFVSVVPLQVLMSKVNRKFRASLDRYKADYLKCRLKEHYVDSVKQWFSGGEGLAVEDIPF